MKITLPLAALGIFLGSLSILPAQTAEAPAPSAEALWDKLRATSLSAPPKTKDEMVTYGLALDAAATELIEKYPNDTHIWEAKLMAAQMQNVLALMGQPGFTIGQGDTLAHEVASASAAPARMRQEASLMLIQSALRQQSPDFEPSLAAYQHQYPNDGRADMLEFSYAQQLSESNPDKAAAMFKKLSQSSNSQVAKAAQAMLAASNLLGHPVDLKFTAIDGKEVDLSKMTGKVVLIDFWATWCGPCMSEVPDVVATYKKYHDQGFDIVGISLDESKDKLLQVTKEEGMVWPQYFDGKGWSNDISQRFGIDSIPRMWLVNKKGLLVNLNAREDLASAVQKLLAE